MLLARSRFVFAGAVVVMWIGLARRADGQPSCDTPSGRCAVDPIDVTLDGGSSGSPHGDYRRSGGGADLGAAWVNRVAPDISLGQDVCRGDELGPDIDSLSVVTESADDLTAHAVCDGSPADAAMLRQFAGEVEAPTGTGVSQTVRPDGSGGRGDGSTTDPVDPVTGEFVLENDDLILPSWGVSFDLRRIYRSRVEFTGPLGPSWDHRYNQRLLNLPRTAIDAADQLPTASDAIADAIGPRPLVGVPGCGPSLLLSSGEGTSIQFNEISDVAGTHSYWSSAALLTLKGIDGPRGMTWTLTAPDGTVRSFDAEGRLASWVDANGIGLSFDWSGDAVDARLDSVTDSVGRVITFEYDASNRLVRVAATGSQLVASYGYDGNGALAVAHRADGRTEYYEYDVDSSRENSSRNSRGSSDPSLYDDCIRCDDP